MTVDFKLYLITDRKQTKLPLPEAVRLALQGGVRAIQLREKDLPVRELLDLASKLRETANEFGARLLINDRVDIAVAIDADGVHLGHQSMPPEPVRKMIGKNKLIGVSTHNLAEAFAAEAGGADFITLGPVFFTKSKADFGSPVGLDYIKSVKNSIKIPVFGLGGVTSGNIDRVMNAGVDGVSMISAIFGSADIQKAAESMTREMN